MTIDTFEFGGDPEPLDVTLRNVTRRYYIKDISKHDFDVINEDNVKAGDDVLRKALAQRDFGDRLISQAILREDMKPIPLAEASKLRMPLFTALVKGASEYLFPKPESDGVEAANSDEAKTPAEPVDPKA